MMTVVSVTRWAPLTVIIESLSIGVKNGVLITEAKIQRPRFCTGRQQAPPRPGPGRPDGFATVTFSHTVVV